MSKKKSEEQFEPAAPRAAMPEELLEGFSAEDSPGSIRFLVALPVNEFGGDGGVTVQYVHRSDDIANLASRIAEHVGNNDAFQAYFNEDGVEFVVVDADRQSRSIVTTGLGEQMLPSIDALVRNAATALEIA